MSFRWVSSQRRAGLLRSGIFWRAAVVAVASIASFASSPSQAAGTVYYVSASTGSDTNTGTQAAPFRQIRKAVSLAVAGDTILVSDGSYLGFDVRSKQGTASAPITIKAVGTSVEVVPTTDRTDNRDTIFVTYSSHIVLEGLRSFNANRAAVRISSSPNVTVRGGVFGNNATWGIFADFSDDLLLENNECFGSKTQHGIYTSNSGDRPTVRGNYLHGNYACGLHMNADVSMGGDGIISGALVERNIVFNNGVGGGSAINMDGVQDSIVRNNLLYNNFASGIAAFQWDGAAGPKGLQILNNTVDQAATARWALLIQNTAGSLFVRNNILFNRNTARGGICYGASADVSNTDSNNNVLDYVTPNNASTRYTLAQWQAQGHETNSLSAPLSSLFVNPAGADYHLLATSPAVDRGATVASVTSDLDALPRPSGVAYDIGCYELQSGGTPPPPPPPPPAPDASATFVRTDTATRGNWKGVYGSQGYNIVQDAARYPAYAQVSASGQSTLTWSKNTKDARGLQKANANGRIAAAWNSATQFSVNVNLTDGSTRAISLYLVDWDNRGRAQLVEILDAGTGAVLDSRSVSAFSGGQYLVWNITGNVRIRITRSAGLNAVLSGLFID